MSGRRGSVGYSEGKEWIKAQMKAFAGWVSIYSKADGIVIEPETMGEQLANGVVLCKLLDHLEGKSIGPYNKKPKMKFHTNENMSQVLNHLESINIKTTGLIPSDLTDKDNNLKLMLGLIWVIILYYNINRTYGEEKEQKGPKKKKVNTKEQMLAWVNGALARSEARHGEEPVTISNFTSDLEDGFVLLRLVEFCSPGAYDVRDHDRGEVLKNLRIAFDEAEKSLDVPQLLDAELHAAGTVDKQSNMTYLGLLRQYDLTHQDRVFPEVQDKAPAAPAVNYKHADATRYFADDSAPKQVSLFWTEEDENDSNLYVGAQGQLNDTTADDTIAFDSISAVRLGKQAPAFQTASAKDADENSSLTLEHSESSTVDVSFASPADRDNFLGYLKAHDPNVRVYTGDELVDGINVTQYTADNKKDRIAIAYNADNDALVWGEADKAVPYTAGQAFAAKEITEIRPGKQTAAFQTAVAGDADEACCVSVVNKDGRTLDIAFDDAASRDRFLNRLNDMASNATALTGDDFVDGAAFNQYQNKDPNKQEVEVKLDERRLDLTYGPKDGESSTFKVQTIDEIRLGKHTTGLTQPVAEDADEQNCFSLCRDNNPLLELEALSPEQFDAWVQEISNNGNSRYTTGDPLEDGMDFTRYAADGSKPTQTILTFHADPAEDTLGDKAPSKGALYYGQRTRKLPPRRVRFATAETNRKTLEKCKVMTVEEIQTVYMGKQTAAFQQPAGEPAVADRCFTIESANDSLELEGQQSVLLIEYLRLHYTHIRFLTGDLLADGNFFHVYDESPQAREGLVYAKDGSLFYTPPSGQEQSVQIKSISSAKIGKNTAAFDANTAHHEKDASVRLAAEDCSFSLVTESATVDLEARSAAERDAFLDALRAVNSDMQASTGDPLLDGADAMQYHRYGSEPTPVTVYWKNDALTWGHDGECLGKDIISIKLGKQTEAWQQKIAEDCDEEFCLSVMKGEEAVLELYFGDNQTRTVFLQYLMPRLPHAKLFRERFNLVKCLAETRRQLIIQDNPDVLEDLEPYMGELRERWLHLDTERKGLVSFEEIKQAVWYGEEDNAGLPVPEGPLVAPELKDIYDDIVNGTGNKEPVTFWDFVPFVMEDSLAIDDLEIDIPPREKGWAHADDHLVGYKFEGEYEGGNFDGK